MYTILVMDWTVHRICTGGMQGVAFTLKEERRKSHNVSLYVTLAERTQSRQNDDIIIDESATTSFLWTRIGESHVLMLLKDTPSPPTAKL